MNSKYIKPVLEILNGEWQSTYSVVKAVEKKCRKRILWITIYTILLELKLEGKIQSLKTKSSMFWKKK